MTHRPHFARHFTRSAMGRLYTFDGRRVSLREFAEANMESDPDLVRAIAALRPGESLTVGGGAQPLSRIQRNPVDSFVIVKHADGTVEVIDRPGSRPARRMVQAVRGRPGTEAVVASARRLTARERRRGAPDHGEWEVEAWAEENPRTLPVEPGVWGDSTLGHRHIRERLIDLSKEINAHAREHGEDEPVDREIIAVLRGAALDDYGDEDEAIDCINDYLDRYGLIADLQDGDLIVETWDGDE